MSRIDTFTKLHNNLFDYVKRVTNRPNMNIPTVAESILFLNTAVDLNYSIDDLETKYKEGIDGYDSVTDEQKNKVRKYLTAMLELLRI